MIPISKIDLELSIYKDNLVIMFGIGEIGKKLLNLMSSFDIKPAYICDNDSVKWGQTYTEIPIISPKQLAEINKKNSNVLIQLATNARFEEEILAQLNDLNIMQTLSSSEALNRLSYYQFCDFFKENTTFLDSLSSSVKYSDYAFHPEHFSFLSPHIYKILTEYNNLPIFVTMIGKTGDHTIIDTISHNGGLVYKMHPPKYLSKDIMCNVKSKVKIIVAIRDPISLDLSYLYQFIYNDNIQPIEALYNKSNDFQSLSELTFQKNKQHRISDWFNVFCENLVDLKCHPFDKKTGFCTIQEGNYDIFVYQLEKLNHIVTPLSDWVGIPFTELIGSNITENKWVSESYKKAKKDIKISKEYFDMCYSDPYVQHFYSEEDIETFKNRWRSHIRM